MPDFDQAIPPLPLGAAAPAAVLDFGLAAFGIQPNVIHAHGLARGPIHFKIVLALAAFTFAALNMQPTAPVADIVPYYASLDSPIKLPATKTTRTGPSYIVVTPSAQGGVGFCILGALCVGLLAAKLVMLFPKRSVRVESGASRSARSRDIPHWCESSFPYFYLFSTHGGFTDARALEFPNVLAANDLGDPYARGTPLEADVSRCDSVTLVGSGNSEPDISSATLLSATVLTGISSWKNGAIGLLQHLVNATRPIGSGIITLFKSLLTSFDLSSNRVAEVCPYLLLDCHLLKNLQMTPNLGDVVQAYQKIIDIEHRLRLADVNEDIPVNAFVARVPYMAGKDNWLGLDFDELQPVKSIIDESAVAKLTPMYHRRSQNNGWTPVSRFMHHNKHYVLTSSLSPNV